MMPTANSIDMPSRGGMTTPNTMIAAPTAMTVTVCPTPQAAPISAEPATLRSRLTIVAMATTWSASVACRIPRKKPRNRKDTTFRAAPVIAHFSRWHRSQRTFRADTPNDTSARDSWSIRAIPIEDRGRTLIDTSGCGAPTVG